MKKLLITLAVFFSASVFSQPVHVTGTGASQKEAMDDGFRRAIEQASGTVTTSSLEMRKNRLTKNDVGNYSAGYIDKYKILEIIEAKNSVSIEMEVWVRPSRMAEQKLHPDKIEKDIDGGRLATQYKSYLQERSSADNFLNNIVLDFPHKALTIKQSDAEIFVDAYRNAVFKIPFEIEWNQRYLASLKEHLKNLESGKENWDVRCMCWQAAQRITVVSKENPKQWSWDTDTYYFNDIKMSETMVEKFSMPPSIVASIFDTNRNLLYKQCFQTSILYGESKATTGFFVNGFRTHKNVLNLPISRDSDLAKVLDRADSVELALQPGENCR